MHGVGGVAGSQVADKSQQGLENVPHSDFTGAGVLFTLQQPPQRRPEKGKEGSERPSLHNLSPPRFLSHTREAPLHLYAAVGVAAAAGVHGGAAEGAPRLPSSHCCAQARWKRCP
jgi:hypothetical protein